MMHNISIAIGIKNAKEIFKELAISNDTLDSFFERPTKIKPERKLQELSSFLKSKSYSYRKRFCEALDLNGEKISVELPPEPTSTPATKILTTQQPKPIVKPKPTRRFAPRSDIAVITCFFNPCNFSALIKNYHRFARQLKEQRVPLYTCEAVFDGQDPQISYGNVVHVKTDSVLFIKESLLNIAETIVPEQYTKIIFMDCDFLFSEPDWAWEASYILDEKPVLQCMRNLLDLDEKGMVSRKTHSMAFKIDQGRPGGGWAVHREIFTHLGGLYDKMITGGGDMIHTWGGFFGNIETNKHWTRQYNRHFQKSWKDWCKPVSRYVRGDIGLLQVDVAHLFHGTRENRQYVTRSACVIEVNPDRDLIYNEDGVITWNLETAPKEAVLCMKDYFKNRKEDCSASGDIEIIDPEQINWNDSWLES